MPKPVTRTEVALVVLHVSLAVPPQFIVVGETPMAAVMPALAVTVTVAVRVSGPPVPCAVRVKVCVPTARPVTVCVPPAAVLAMPGPLTATELALLVVQVSAVLPGAVVDVGEALIEPVTFGTTGVTATVAVRVTGPPGPWAVSVKVCVPAERPLTFWVPLVAVLVSDGPLTNTDVALAVLHAIVVTSGAVPVEGLAAIEPATDAGEVMTTVTVCVAGPPGPCAVIV